MKPPRPTPTREQRINTVTGINIAITHSLAGIVRAFAVAHYARDPLSFQDRLGQAILLTIPLLMGGTFLWVRTVNRRQETATAVTRQPTAQQRQETQHSLFWATAHTIAMCVVCGYFALDILFHSPLGWGYKACLVAAVNGLAFVLMRFVPVVAWHIKRGTWESPVATDVPAPVAAPVAVCSTAATKPEDAAPLVVGRKP